MESNASQCWNQQTPQQSTDDRNRRISNISNISTDSQLSENFNVVDEKNICMVQQQTGMSNHQQQNQAGNGTINVLASATLNGNLGSSEPIQHVQTQVLHQNVLPTVVAGSMLSTGTQIPVQTAIVAELVTKSKTKEVSSTLPNQAHEPMQNPQMIQQMSQNEQFFQPIQPEMSLPNFQIQNQMQHNVQQVTRQLHHLGNSFWVI